MRRQKKITRSGHDIILSFIFAIVAFSLMVIMPGIILPFNVLAAPPLQSDYFGSVYVDGYPAMPGTLIEALDQDGTLCGKFEVAKKGVFGYLSCTQKEAYVNGEHVWFPRQNEKISFRINGDEAIIVGNSSWVPGSLKKIKLVLDSRTIASITNNAATDNHDENDGFWNLGQLSSNNILLLFLAAVLIMGLVAGGYIFIKRKDKLI